jgi:hypothetical protein
MRIVGICQAEPATLPERKTYAPAFAIAPANSRAVLLGRAELQRGWHDEQHWCMATALDSAGAAPPLSPAGTAAAHRTGDQGMGGRDGSTIP